MEILARVIGIGGILGFVISLILLIVAIVQWNSKVPPIIGMAVSFILFGAGVVLLPDGDLKETAPPAVSVAGTPLPEKEDEPEENDSVWAADFTPVNDFRYALDKTNHTITLNRYKGNDTKILLSPVYTIDGVDYQLTSLGDDACFFGKISITSIFVPEGVTYISAPTFNSCAELQYLYLPSTVETISSQFLSYLDPYTVYTDSMVTLPQERDTENYEETIDDISQSGKLGESVGGALNGLMAGFASGLENDGEEIPMEIYYGGTADQWNSFQ